MRVDSVPRRRAPWWLALGALLLAAPRTLGAQEATGASNTDQTGGRTLHYVVEAARITDDSLAPGTSLISWLRSSETGFRVRSLFGEPMEGTGSPRHGNASVISLRRRSSADSIVHILSVDSVAAQIDSAWRFRAAPPGNREFWVWDSAGRPREPWGDTSMVATPTVRVSPTFLNAAGAAIGLVPPRLPGRKPALAWADTVESSPSAPVPGIPSDSSTSFRLIRSWRFLSADTLAMTMDMVVSTQVTFPMKDDVAPIGLQESHALLAALVVLDEEGAVRTAVTVARRFLRVSAAGYPPEVTALLPPELSNVFTEIGRVTAIRM